MDTKFLGERNGRQIRQPNILKEKLLDFWNNGLHLRHDCLHFLYLFLHLALFHL